MTAAPVAGGRADQAPRIAAQPADRHRPIVEADASLTPRSTRGEVGSMMLRTCRARLREDDLLRAWTRHHYQDSPPQL